MKDIPKKQLPEISGGEFQDGGCIPQFGDLPGDYPRTPSNPFDVPQLDTDQAGS
jgi:hypothetical protein